MDDAGGVGLGESLGDLNSEVEKSFCRKRLSRGEQIAQGLSLDELALVKGLR